MDPDPVYCTSNVHTLLIYPTVWIRFESLQYLSSIQSLLLESDSEPKLGSLLLAVMDRVNVSLGCAASIIQTSDSFVEDLDSSRLSGVFGINLRVTPSKGGSSSLCFLQTHISVSSGCYSAHSLLVF